MGCMWRIKKLIDCTMRLSYRLRLLGLILIMLKRGNEYVMDCRIALLNEEFDKINMMVIQLRN